MPWSTEQSLGSTISNTEDSGLAIPELSESIAPLIRTCVNSVTAAMWRRCVQHAREEEDKDRHLFNRTVIDIDPGLANIMGSDSDESDEG